MGFQTDSILFYTTKLRVFNKTVHRPSACCAFTLHRPTPSDISKYIQLNYLSLLTPIRLYYVEVFALYSIPFSVSKSEY